MNRIACLLFFSLPLKGVDEQVPLAQQMILQAVTHKPVPLLTVGNNFIDKQGPSIYHNSINNQNL